jgi:hypothetical protein
MVLAQKQIWRPVEQNRRPDINPCSYAHLTFDKGTKNIWWRKDSLFNKGCWENWISACRKLRLYSCLWPSTSIKLKWLKVLNIRPEALQLIQEKARNTLEAIEIGNDFLNRTQVAQQLSERIDKWDHIKLKSSAQQKKCFLNWRGHLQNERESFPAIHLTRGW